METYVAGVSTRLVDDMVAALGIDSGISKSEASRICASLNEVVTAVCTRRLDHTAFSYDYLDATYLHVRSPASQVVSMAIVGAILADVRDEWPSGERRYLSEASMAQLKPTSDTDHVAAVDSGA